MGRRKKSTKGKAEATRTPAGTSPKDDGAKVRDLEKRLAETLEREAGAVQRETEALGQLQTRNRELVESREQQTAASEILRVIASSPTDVQRGARRDRDECGETLRGFANGCVPGQRRPPAP